ncbi:hypothetical protein BaRGS_00031267, partial [Batillaria attramentaria]
CLAAMFAADATDIKMSVQLSVFIKTPPTIGQTHPLTISRRDMMSWRFFQSSSSRPSPARRKVCPAESCDCDECLATVRRRHHATLISRSGHFCSAYKSLTQCCLIKTENVSCGKPCLAGRSYRSVQLMRCVQPVS